jgi:hypothetical protein
MMGNTSKKLSSQIDNIEKEEENSTPFCSLVTDTEYKGKLNDPEAGIIPRAMNQVFYILFSLIKIV